MKKMYCLPNTKMLLLALAITAVLGTSPRQVNAQVAAPIAPATTIKTVPTVEIMPSMWEYDTKHTNNDFFIQNGTAYLSYTQASVMFQDLVWSYNQKSGILNVSGPNRTLSWKINSKTAILNGHQRQMSSPLLQRNGDIHLPLRDLLNWAGGTLKSSKNNKITVSYTILNAVSGDAKDGWYWVRKDNGIVYAAIGSEMPHNIGQSAVRANQFTEMSVTKADDHSIVLQLNHSYGEPLMYDDIYKLYIYNGKLVRESRVMYNGGSPRESIREADGFTIMLNGTDLLLVRANGTLEHQYDLKELGGLDESYTVEYVSVADGILLIRPYVTQTLLLIDLQLDAPVALYKDLLSKEDQDYFEKFEQLPWMTLSDGLQYVKRDGNLFTFKHTSTQTHGSEELTYRLNH